MNNLPSIFSNHLWPFIFIAFILWLRLRSWLRSSNKNVASRSSAAPPSDISIPSPRISNTSQETHMNPVSALIFVVFLGGAALSFVAHMPMAITVILAYSAKMAQQWEKAVILRLGKLQAIKGPGLFILVPIFDQVAMWIDQRIRTTEVNAEQALTKDTVPVNVDAIVFWMVHDAERAALEIADYSSAVQRVAQTSLREMIGSSVLSELLSERKE